MSTLLPDCAACAALCCVAPCFRRSADFPVDKEAGERCPELGDDDRCTVHGRLRVLGFVGCDVFDCFGAGQRLTRATSEPAARHARLSLATAGHQGLWLLDEASRRGVEVQGLRQRLDEAVERYARSGDGDLPEVLERVRTELRAASAALRGPGAELEGADLAGVDLRDRELRDADLRSALLLGADLRDAELERTDLTGADLRGARLHGADLTHALFVSDAQLRAAEGDLDTRLPDHLERPSHWRPALELTLLDQLDDLAPAVRELMDEAFDGDFTDEDWEHGLGGVHSVLVDAGEVVAHASVVPRPLWIEERRLAVGYVEAVAVLPERQGEGLGTQVMRALDEALDASELGVLSTGEHRFYERLGWERWAGPTWVREAEGDRRTADEDDGIMIRRTPTTGELSLHAAIVCEPRDGDDW